MNRVEPIVGQWYLDRDTGQTFEVVSTDDIDGLVELQDYDGNLDEIEQETWSALNLEAVDPPEDLAGVFDNPELDETDDGEGDFGGVRYEPFPSMRQAWQDPSLELAMNE